MDSHEKYLELCAASTVGELSAEEEQELKKHLAVCASCRRARHEYESAVQKAVPALADDLSSPSEDPNPRGPSSRQRRLSSSDWKRIRTLVPPPGTQAEGPEIEPAGRRFTYRPSRIPWAELWMPVAACALLAIALGIVAYRSGLKRGADTAQKQTMMTAPSSTSLEEQISDAGHERAQLMATLADDDRAIKDLKREVAEQNDEING